MDALAILADVSKRDQVNDMMAQAMSHFGKIDVLVSNAGDTSPQTVYGTNLGRLGTGAGGGAGRGVHTCAHRGDTVDGGEPVRAG